MVVNVDRVVKLNVICIYPPYINLILVQFCLVLKFSKEFRNIVSRMKFYLSFNFLNFLVKCSLLKINFLSEIISS